MPILTDAICEAKVSERTKIYDAKCAGLYVDKVPARDGRPQTATFCFKRPYVRIATYRPADDLQAFTIKEARIAARDLQSRIELGEDVSANAQREQASQRERQGLTINKLIELRVTFMETPEPKGDGKLRPRVESHKNVASHLRRLVGPRLGRKLVADVKREDIATLADDIVEGRFGKPSKSNARHMCMAVSGMFNWAIERGFITMSPAVRLGKWTNKSKTVSSKSKRVLSAIEIKQLWHGLDNDDLAHDRRTRLALKFELVSMLRGGEFLSLRKDEIKGLGGPMPYLFIPLERVKNRKHDLLQPLSSLAVEIITEALKDNPTDYVFATPQRGGKRINEPLGNQATASALRDRKDKDTEGLCKLLGLAKFTPHDLRRTAATVTRAIGVPLSKVSMCLDHAVKREEGISIPDVTRLVYVHAHHQELAEKLETLEKLASEIRRITDQHRVADDLPMAA